MSFDPFLAEHRFGYGLSPKVAAPVSVQEMLAGVAGSDAAQTTYPIPGYRHLQDQLVFRRRFRQYARRNAGTPEAAEAQEKLNVQAGEMRRDRAAWFGQTMLRRITTTSAFRERLVAFWADHFTVQGKGGLTGGAATLFIEEAIRPHIAGRFADLLTAAVTHPVMLHYLDQTTSVGANSRVGMRRNLGLNENLAREVLELHTLGVQGPYGQADVRAFANLLTGLGKTRDYGFAFRKNMVEPGPKTVLGKEYAETRTIAPILEAFGDLAAHPVTARHLARKLAVHFLSDTPPEAVVDRITKAFEHSEGALMDVYEALLTTPEAWREERVNIRPPEEFVSTALRVLGPSETIFTGLKPRDVGRIFIQPLTVMGQLYQRPGGPDGWPEEDSAWITPQGIAARLEWAMSTPARVLPDLPEPRAFLQATLGGAAPPELSFAVDAAENRAVAVGLVLASPAMQRR